MTIDQNGLVSYNWPAAAFSVWPNGPFTFPCAETAGGGRASQSVTTNVCVAPKTWHSDHGMCM